MHWPRYRHLNYDLQASDHSLFFGRDPLGQRSLLFRLTRNGRSSWAFELASTSLGFLNDPTPGAEFCEVSTAAILQMKLDQFEGESLDRINAAEIDSQQLFVSSDGTRSMPEGIVDYMRTLKDPFVCGGRTILRRECCSDGQCADSQLSILLTVIHHSHRRSSMLKTIILRAMSWTTSSNDSRIVLLGACLICGYPKNNAPSIHDDDQSDQFLSPPRGANGASRLAVLFSGGIDCTVIAYIADKYAVWVPGRWLT